MKCDKQLKGLEQKMENVTANSRGHSWEEFEREIFTHEEIAESNLRVAIIGEKLKTSNDSDAQSAHIREAIRQADCGEFASDAEVKSAFARWNGYIDEKIKRAEEERNDPNAVEYSFEEFFAKARSRNSND